MGLIDYRKPINTEGAEGGNYSQGIMFTDSSYRCTAADIRRKIVQDKRQDIAKRQTMGQKMRVHLPSDGRHLTTGDGV